jgi:hypothetical protein
MVQRSIPRLGVGLVGLVVLGLAEGAYSSATAGEESINPARFGRVSDDSGNVAAVEAYARWSAGDEYSLTSSGAIVPTELLAGSRSLLSVARQIGAPFGSSPLGDARLGSVAVDKQFDDFSTVETAACGPSPLTPEEVGQLVGRAAQRHGVDPGLAIAVVAVESDFDRNRNSPAGARGPMQLMPATAARFGVSDPCEPEANIDAGVRYLGLLLEEFKNPIVAVAAYNAGEDRIYQYGGIPPFPETVSYVAKVVNHQLGLQMPRRGTAGGSHRTAGDDAADRGVVQPTSRRQWVAGVMQF